jgi:hypothetical protein
VRYLPKVIDQRIKLIAQIGRCWRLADGDWNVSDDGMLRPAVNFSARMIGVIMR